ncbi:MAG: type II toxin-antitoxin system VapB family antitoxin [Lentisphaerae bacterium]|nr:type II toxin-antitoxin system VapB family antitoxin [Lentisphaerota bacterium]
MRTNIILDDNLMDEAARYSQARSKKALVHEALASYVATRRAEQQRESYKDRLSNVRRRVGAARTKESAASLVRRDRARSQ